jgi:AbrB family looped-hinge helix DNA binding protein
MVGIRLTSKVGKKGQVVIPKPIRTHLGIKPNSVVSFTMEDGKVVLTGNNPEETARDFVSLIKDKKKLPRRIDWDEEYYSQFKD